MSFIEKQKQVIDLFNQCQGEEARYEKIIELGRKQQRLDLNQKIPENIVKGCQSTMYLYSCFKDGCVFFQAESDALISAGLAALLIAVYDGETPESILKNPPDYLETLGIKASLTPNRANGLYSIHLRMKQDALKFILSGKS